ncbi:MAG TPA: hypothetical protein VF942_11795, partial [Acidimicrobiales bacterium]
LAAACAPVIVVADRPAPSYCPGEAVRLDVHVVSDLRSPIVGGRVRAELSSPATTRTWWFEGDVEADSCTRVGTLHVVLPDLEVGRPNPSGPLTVDLDFAWSGGKAHNRYHSVLQP